MAKQLLKTFLIFYKVGITTFGGGYAILPILQAELVDKRHWLSEERLTDLYATAQCEPGPIAINVSVLIATEHSGRLAGIAASLGVSMPSFAVILLIASLLDNFRDITQVQQALAGVKVAVAALVVYLTYKMIRSNVKSWFAAAVFLISSVMMILNVSSAVMIIIGSAAVGIIYFLIRRGRREKA